MDPRFLIQFVTAVVAGVRDSIGTPFLAWWRDRPRWLRGVLLVSVGTPVLVLGSAAAAHAAGTSPAVLGWIEVSDSNGISIWNYELSLDRGGVTSPGKLIWSFVTDLMWGFYLTAVGLAIWMIDWTLGFSWLDLLTSPLMRVGDALTSVVDQLGLVPTLLTITAVVAALQMMRGRLALGMFELFLSAIIAALAVGVLANPVALVGGENGLLYQSRDLSLGVASGLANEGDTSGSPEEFRERVTGSLTDTFVRAPAQIINFGEVLEGTRCEEVYTDVLEDGPYGEEDDIRSAVGRCDSDYKDVADNPNSGMATSSVVSMLAAGLLLVFAVVLSGTVLVAGVYALYQALRMIVTLLAGMLPGGSRGSLWMTFAELIVSLVTLVFATVFLAVYLLIVQALFSAGDADNRMQTFVIVDIIMVVGLIVFWKGRQRIKDASARIAQALSNRPGAGPTALPQRGQFDATQAYFKARMAGSAARTAAGAVGAVAGSPGRLHNAVADAGSRHRMSEPAAASAGSPGAAGAGSGVTGGWGTLRGARAHSGPGARAELATAGGPGSGGGPAGGEDPALPGPAGPAPQQLRERLDQRSGKTGRLARTGTAIGLAAATGGTSAVVSVVARQAGRQALAGADGAAGTAGSARRAELSARLQPKALPSAAASSSAANSPAATHGASEITRPGSRLSPSPAAAAAAASPVQRLSGAAPRPTRPQPPQSTPQSTPGAEPSTTTATATAEHDEAARRLRARLEARRATASTSTPSRRSIALPAPSALQGRSPRSE